MNTNRIAFTTILALIIAISFSSCKKEEIEYRQVPDIHGQWQLVAAYGSTTIIDYISHNIIYDFQANNVLTVSGEIEGIKNYKGHEIGKYSYNQIPNPISTEPMQPTMWIDIFTHGYIFGYVNFDFYEGSAMILSPHKDSRKRASIFLVRIESTDTSSKM